MFAGIVEGFYGPTWDFVGRVTLLEFLGRVGLGLYIYGPKWDPYHRLRWRSPYSVQFIDYFSKLVNAGRRYGVEVVFSLSPGLDIDYSSDSDLRLLLRKFEVFLNLGVEAIALFLDDIPPVVRGRGFKSLAEAQATLANRVYGELKPKALILCPTYYRGVARDYMSELGRFLDPEVLVMWTGPYVCSISISEEDVRRVTEALGRKPFIWDNYPVNDYFTCRGITRLHLGPIKNRAAELAEAVSGYVANPANQVEASKIPLYTIAEMLRSGAKYDPWRSLKEAVNLVVNKPARYWFSRFLEFNKATFMDVDEEVINSGNASEVLEVVRNVKDTLTNKELLREIDPVLNKMEEIARYSRGEDVVLNYRVQTAGEYNPPMSDEHMRNEMFGDVVRRTPWYVKTYPEQKWW